MDASSLAFKITAFEDANCKIPYLKFNQYFVIDSVNGVSINLKTQKVTYTALSEEVASALRSIRYCGIQNWDFASETNVTGKMCEDYQQLAEGDFFYQIIKTESTTLKFGATTKKLDGRSHQMRPVQFDDPDYFLK